MDWQSTEYLACIHKVTGFSFVAFETFGALALAEKPMASVGPSSPNRGPQPLSVQVALLSESLGPGGLCGRGYKKIQDTAKSKA